MPRPEQPGRDRGGPLAGVRVLEITKVWAGPYAGKLLAHLGAEVIKVESSTNMDEMRAYGGVDIDAAPYFLSINQEILSVQVNMKTPDGLDLVKRMVAAADIVIDNIRPGAMERSSLGYEDLKQIRPDIIQCSIKMWGTDGPLGYQTGYAPSFAALSGLTALVGHEGETPRGMNIRYGDSTAGACAALACIAALHHRERTGEGQYIDLSAVEAMTSLVGDSLFAYSVTGEVPESDGNFHPEMCPHGAYPCEGGEWISIAVADDDEWRELCEVLGAGELLADLRHATPRRTARAPPRARCRDRRAHRLAPRGEARRRAAQGRGARVQVDEFARLVLGRVPVGARGLPHGQRPPSWHPSDHRPFVADGPRSARGSNAARRLLGEHNDYVYREILGLQAEELDDLVARAVVN